MVIQFSDVLQLKDAVNRQFGLYLHFHDACGAQFFSFDEAVDPSVKDFIIDYFSDKNCTVEFNDDMKNFSIR